MTTREKIIRILDREKAWDHVVVCYIDQARESGLYAFRKNGQPDRRWNVGRLVVALNSALDKSVWIEKGEQLG